MELKNEKIKHYLFIGVVLLFPVLFRILFGSTYHSFDVGTFNEWIAYTHPFQTVYQTDCYCNYPIIGLLLSTGMMKIMDNYLFFFLYLAFFESINVLLFYKLLSSWKIKRKRLYSLLFMVLPSTISGGALWGQIDHIGLTFLFLLLILLSHLFQQSEAKKQASWWLFPLIGSLFYLALFSKQLLVFPLFPIGIAFLFLIFRFCNTKQLLSAFLLALSGFLVLMIPVEWWLSYPQNGHFTHYQRILESGSDHLDIISGNGITIWQFFYSELEHPSTEPFGLFLSPKTTGIIITCVMSCWIFYHYFKKVRYSTEISFQIGLICLVLALFNLSFNLFLTGTHERYLFYFYPFLILAFAGLSKHNLIFNTFDKMLFFIGSISYGIFVLAILKGWLKVDGAHVNTIYHKLLPILHLVIFVRLMLLLQKIPRKIN